MWSNTSREAQIVTPAACRYQCSACQGARSRHTIELCSACDLARNLLGLTAPVCAISVYRKPSRLRDLLSTYKQGYDVFDPTAMGALSSLVAAVMASGTVDLSGLGAWGVLQVVPSTRSPDCDDLARLFAGAGMQTADLLRWSGLSAAHRVFTPELFEAHAKARGRRVLLLEDVYVSGSRSQSAAAALRRAGYDVAGVLVIGRRVNPDFDELSQRYWDECVAETGETWGRSA